MPAPLIPQEIFLLERYASREYFEQLVAAFSGCVAAAEGALAKFLRHLPPDYRSRPLWQQPDAAWGETVLPNLRSTLAYLNSGLIQISNGDMTGLASAGSVSADFAALARDYDSDWMPDPESREFDLSMRRARKLARNIYTTQLNEWLPGTLTANYQLDTRGDLDPPPTWPVYRLHPNAQVATGQTVSTSGVYLPFHEGSSAQFLIKGSRSPQCSVTRRQLDPVGLSAARDLFDTTWALVERVADTGGGTAAVGDSVSASDNLRCEAGEACPKAGWWLTPADQQGRRHFVQGEIMPAVAGDYGRTIWQWDADQSN